MERDPVFCDGLLRVGSCAQRPLFARAGSHRGPACVGTGGRRYRGQTGARLGETRLAVAFQLYTKLEYDRAREEVAAARRTLPNNPRTFELSGYINRRQGRWEEAARDLEHALELDPTNVATLHQLASTHEGLYTYAAKARVLERILALKPGDFDARISRAQLEFYWRADTRPLRELIAARLKEDPAAAKKLVQIRIALAIHERDTAGLAAALEDLGDRTWGGNALRYTRPYGEGLLARMKGDEAGARAAFTAARIAQEKIVQAQPDYGPALSVLGLIDAGLGRKEEAIREGRRAVELLPVSKDSINGPFMINNLAAIYAWLGEKDLAVEQVRIFTQLPSGPSHGFMKSNPRWDLLCGYPPFEEIVASLAPKE